jgi:flagellum-specific peptidoglycan hydrolase FlgJ
VISPAQQSFLDRAYKAARAAGHIFPEMAACEAALESSWGASGLAVQANNLFGRKVWHPGPDVVSIPTREFLNGEWTTVQALWRKFPDYDACLKDRFEILTSDPRYKAALTAARPEDYIRAVSKVWATDPDRAEKVLAVYRAHAASLAAIV